MNKNKNKNDKLTPVKCHTLQLPSILFPYTDTWWIKASLSYFHLYSQ